MYSLFLQLFAIQMLIDFLPMPWKGKIGLFRDTAKAGGVLAAVVSLAAIIPQNTGENVVEAFYLSVLLGVLYWVTRDVLRRSPVFRKRTGVERAAVLLGISAVGAVILPLCFPLLERVAPQRLTVGAVRSSLSGAHIAAYAIGYLFSLGVGGLIVGSLLSKLQREISQEESAQRQLHLATANGPAVADEEQATAESEADRPQLSGLESSVAGGGIESAETLQIEEGIRYAGRLIGFFEAFIVTTLVIVGRWEAIGFIMAAKAIGRYRQMNVRRFSEYFLIGTFANVSIAIIGGLLVAMLIRFM